MSKLQKFKGILGINIGKNADTPVENAVDDYLICLEKVYNYASYVIKYLITEYQKFA